MPKTQFFKTLGDETRLRCLYLLQTEGELCVCELTAALEQSQPKISRHLAQMRQCGVLSDRREGQWVYYRIHAELPDWARQVLHILVASAEPDCIHKQDESRLQQWAARPANSVVCGN